jgi:hypothetical protein
MNAIDFPSGLHASSLSVSGSLSSFGVFVSWRGVAPGFASITKTSQSFVRSMSSWRLLTNAMRAPSGENAGSPSLNAPGVRRSLFFVGEIEKVKMLTFCGEVALFVLLELKAVDDDRRLRLVLLDLRLGVFDDQREMLAVGRPVEVVDASLELGHALRFAALQVHDPELIELVVVAAAGEERELPAVRAPLRRRLAAVAERELADVRAVEAGKPDVRVVLVVVERRLAHGVRDARAVG